jgi:hypothetical protein
MGRGPGPSSEGILFRAQPAAQGQSCAPWNIRELSIEEKNRTSGPAAIFHFQGELSPGIPRDLPAFAAGQGSAGVFQCQKKFGALALTFLPQSQSLPEASCSECKRPLSIARRAKAC